MSELITKRIPGSHASDTEIQTALTAIALASGNVTKAARTLKEATGIEHSAATLRSWKDKVYADEYRRVCEEIMPALTERMAQSDEALVQAAHELQMEALEKMHEKLPDASLNEAVNVYGKTAINAGIHTDKALLRRGQPTEIKQTISVTDALKKLKAIAPGLVDVNPMLIEGEAEEIEPDSVPDSVPDELTSGPGWPE